MSNRIEKGNSLIKRCVSEIISNELNDPRLKNEMITVSRVHLSSDLKYAKVYLSFYGEENKEEALEIIKNASGFIRSSLKDKIKFRVLPMLDFALDDSSEYSEKINKLLKNIKYSDETEE